jgi:hypothetical protein
LPHRHSPLLKTTDTGIGNARLSTAMPQEAALSIRENEAFYKAIT